MARHPWGRPCQSSSHSMRGSRELGMAPNLWPKDMIYIYIIIYIYTVYNIQYIIYSIYIYISVYTYIYLHDPSRNLRDVIFCASNGIQIVKSHSQHLPNEVVISFNSHWQPRHGPWVPTMQKINASRQTPRNTSYIPTCLWYSLFGFQHVPRTVTNTQLWSWVILACWKTTCSKYLMIWTDIIHI